MKSEPRKMTLSNKEEKQFLELIEDNQEKIYRIAYSYVKNKEDALDIVQDSTYKAYISYGKLINKEYEVSWLVRIVINTAIDYLNKSKKVVRLEQKDVESMTIDSNTEDVNKKLDVSDALDKLNERQKTVILLRFFEDMKLGDIAEIMNIPLSTVKSTLYRALKALEIELKE